jgi:DNA helicase-2/ATP-dependent DNA helicase PcrA
MTPVSQSIVQSILETDHHILVAGGPGSGKTTVALKKAIHRIEKGLTPGQNVLFLSFSRAAVARIAEASKTESPADKRANLTLQTFHSFCWELLRSFGYLLGSPTKLKILLPHQEKSLSSGATHESSSWPEWQHERERLFTEEGRVVFDLFAPKSAELLKRSSSLRELIAKRYPLVIVDEAQDTGPSAWACIEHLAPLTQVLCLADLEQQIFDHLEGVGPHRLEEIKKSLKPIQFDLGTENNRSKGTEIGLFGGNILSCKTGGGPYKGVSTLRYNPATADLTKLMHSAVGIIWKTIEKQTGKNAESCVILAPSGSGVARITAGLSAGERPISHKVLFDEAEVLLAIQLAAFLLEPKTKDNLSFDIAEGLELVATVRRAAGSKSSLQEASTLQRWASQMRAGITPSTKMVKAMKALMIEAAKLPLAGEPAKDWLQVKRLLIASSEPSVSNTAAQLDYLVAFRRGRRIASNLSLMWQQAGCYSRAREAVNSALAEDQIMGGIEDLNGIHVMTIHRSKGKQFDGVIIFRESRRVGARAYESSFVWRGDQSPYLRSRKILRVAITRAKAHVLILDPIYPSCPILSGHNL